MDLTKIAQHNIFDLISKDWMLITAGNSEKFNTMTASWGGFGFIWNKPVAFIFVRESRYTHEFLGNDNKVTLSFFDEKYRNALKICGSQSGRNTNKVKDANLTPKILSNGAVTFEEAHTTANCRILYSTQMVEKDFRENALFEQFYIKAPGGLHTMYIVEINEVG
jgi:flavin reductase (DIM6/NTAB) family NADH-FMN oxidoreductase RutF